MKVIKRLIEYLIAIAVIPAIALTVKSATELKDVKNVQYELLSEEDGVFNITPGTFKKLAEYKRIKNYVLESNYPLITQEEMERATWELDELKNEIYIDENGQKRIRLEVGQIKLDGSEPGWWMSGLHPNNIYIVTVPIPEMQELAGAHPRGYIKEFDVYLRETEYYTFPYASSFTGEELFLTLPPDFLPVMTLDNFKNYLSQNPLTITYELAVPQDRPVEVYDFSTFRLVFEKNRIKVLFDIDDGYYLWEITRDDKMIPINGQYDLGNVWTVKFYVYEIQQPLIRNLVLFIPLIVVGGLLAYMMKKKDLSF